MKHQKISVLDTDDGKVVELMAQAVAAVVMIELDGVAVDLAEFSMGGLKAAQQPVDLIDIPQDSSVVPVAEFRQFLERRKALVLYLREDDEDPIDVIAGGIALNNALSFFSSGSSYWIPF